MQINQVATAAEEQTATTSEITNSIHQISEVVQDTATGAHESAKEANQLSGNAEELQRLVRTFRLLEQMLHYTRPRKRFVIG